MKKIFLTSATCMMAACPALAVVDNNNNQCVDTNLGTASGSTALEAIWGLNNYQCSGGQYFDTTNATCVQCTSNNYCPGGTYSVESQTNGLNACPNGYAMSVAGSDADTDCYRACTTTDVAHSTAVTGEYYYGDNNQCAATSCAIGWGLVGKEFFDSYNNYYSSNSAYVGNDGAFHQETHDSIYRDAAYYDMTSSDINTWGADFENWGTVKGSAYSSAKAGNNHNGQWGGNSSDWTAKTSELDAAGTGNFCWCKVDAFRPREQGWFTADRSLWVYAGTLGNYDACAHVCAMYTLTNSLGVYRRALFESSGANDACSLTNYQCGGGQYFDISTATCVQCTSNNYCPGGTYNVESQTNGLNTCPNGYGLSVAGAGSENECYRTCTTGDVAHSLAVSGGYYYGDNNRCEPTSCAAGWHVKSGIDFTDTNNVPSNPTNSPYAYVKLNGATGKGGGVSPDEYTTEYYGIGANGTWGATFTDFGDVRGSAYCSAKPNTASSGSYGTSTTGELSSASGEAKYCWCQIDGLRPAGSDSWENMSSSLWVYLSNSGAESACVNGCSCEWVLMDVNRQSFRQAMFGAIGYIPSTCEANNIVINWYNDQILHDTNQCTYNETITLPEQPNKTGYTFNGWKIKAVPNNN